MTPVDPQVETEVNSQRNWLLPFVGILCLILVVTSFIFIKKWETERFQYNFEKSTTAYTALFQSQFTSYVNYLDDMVLFYQSSQYVDRKEFEKFSSSELEKFPEVEALYWVPFVPDKSRAAYELQCTKDIGKNIVIHEHTSPESMENTTALKRDYYYPITFAEPFDENIESIGFDMGSDPLKRAIFDEIRRTGDTRLFLSTGPSHGHFWSETEFNQTAIMAHPVIKRINGQEHFEGVLLLQFNIGKSSEAAISKVMSGGLDIKLSANKDGMHVPLYFHHSRLGGTSELENKDLYEDLTGYSFRSHINVLDREFTILFSPVERYMQMHYLWQAEFILAVGIIVSLMLLRVMYASQRKHDTIKNLVKRRTAELQASLSRQQAILGSMADSVIVIDKDSKIISFNDAAVRAFGYKESEVQGKDVSVLLPKNEREQHKYYTDNSDIHASRIIRRTRQLMGWHKSGRQFPIELNITPIELTNGRGFVGIIKDISERKMAEEQALQSQKMTALGRLAGGVAHEFNNLLTIISGYARMAEKNIKDEERALASIKEITQASSQAAGLTKQMLSFGRRQEISRAALDVKQLIAELISMLRPLLPENVTLDIHNDTENLIVGGDQHQLTQAIMNLSLNACDAMPDGGTLTITVIKIVADDPKDPAAYASSKIVEIRVKDTGIGMDEIVRGRIFEPFFTTKDIGKGTGLGLAMVHGAITSMDGSINVTSEPGDGTEFIIHLPLLENVTKASAAEESSNAPSTQPDAALEILVVEDQKAVRMLAKDAIESAGHSVTEAENGQDALDLISKRGSAFKIIVSDVAMPQMDGIEMAKEIIKSDPDVFFVFISGHSQFADITTKIPGIKADFLQKPFDPDMLVDIIHEHASSNF